MTKSTTVYAIILLLLIGCNSDSEPTQTDTNLSFTSASQLYSLVLGNGTSAPCTDNCQLSLLGSEWRLNGYSDVDRVAISTTNENLYTLLFSEIDDRVVGLFACNVLSANYSLRVSTEANSSDERATLTSTNLGTEDCLLEGPAAAEYRFVSQFLLAGSVDVRTSGSLMFLENQLGQTLTYRGRLDPLDGEYRSFKNIIVGDYLPLSLNAGEESLIDINHPSTDILIYNSRSEVDMNSPELLAILDSIAHPINYSEQTLVGFFLGKLSYPGPEIKIEHVIERQNTIEVVTESGLFVCDDGLAQPGGENAPYLLSVLNVVGKPLKILESFNSVCP